MKIIKLLFVLMVIIGSASCKKDTHQPRSTQYTLVAENNSGLTGTVSFVEVADSGKTQVDIELQHATLDLNMAHIHYGTPTAYHIIRYDLGTIIPTGSHISNRQNIPLLYDSALVYDGTFIIHDSTGDNIVGLCGIGINK